MSPVRVIIATGAALMPTKKPGVKTGVPLPERATAELEAFLPRLISRGLPQIGFLELLEDDVRLTYELNSNIDGIELRIDFEQPLDAPTRQSIEDELTRTVRGWYPLRRVQQPQVRVQVSSRS